MSEAQPANGRVRALGACRPEPEVTASPSWGKAKTIVVGWVKANLQQPIRQGRRPSRFASSSIRFGRV
jgi:hypothetical protein